MKTFLKKLPVLVTFIAVTVIVAALTVGLLVQPVFKGIKYNVTLFGEGDGKSATFVMKGDTAYLTFVDSDTNKETTWEYYVLKDGSHYTFDFASPIATDGKASSTPKEEIVRNTNNKYNELKQKNLLDKFYDGTYFHTHFNEATSEFEYEDTTCISFGSLDTRSNAYYVHFYGAQTSLQGTSSGAIVYTVLMSVLFTITAIFSVVSAILYVKGKKQA